VVFSKLSPRARLLLSRVLERKVLDLVGTGIVVYRHLEDADGSVTAIGESDEPVKAMMERLNKLEAERATLAEKLRAIESEGNVITLHPAAIDKFASSIEALHDGLSQATDPAAVAGYRAAFRNVFDRFVVHPTPKRHPYEVTPYARLSAIMGLELFPKLRSAQEMLAEQGVTMSFAATETTPTGQKHNIAQVIPLGRWRAAAVAAFRGADCPAKKSTPLVWRRRRWHRCGRGECG
jgi:hypothetical protein